MILDRLSSGLVRACDDTPLIAWADGALRGRRARELGRRLRDDPGAAARAESYRQQNEALAGLRLALPMEDTPDFHPELVTAVARRLRRTRRLRRAAVATAVLCAAMLGGWWTLQPGGGTEGTAVRAGAGSSAIAGFARPDLSAFGLEPRGEEDPEPGVHVFLYEDAQGRPVRVFVAVGEAVRPAAPAAVPRTHVAIQWRRGAVTVTLVAPGDSAWLEEGMRLVESVLPPERPLAAPVVPAAGNALPSAPAPTRPDMEKGRNL